MPAVGTTHHIELGGHYYLVRPGSYLKKAAPQFGARFTTGDPDFNNLSFWQHWAQRCFIGGVDQDLYADDAMYDEGVGLDTSDHERVTLARDLSVGSGSNWNLGGFTNVNGWKAIVYNNTLYALGMTAAGVNSKLYKYVPSTDGWVVQTAFSDFCARSITVYDGKLFMGGFTLAGNAKLVYSSGSIASYTVVTNPAGVGTAGVYAMHAFQQKLYVAYGVNVWRMKDDLTWDGNTVFYKANVSDESNYLFAMETHLGFLYMLSKNGHIHRTDGNSTFDMWSWDGQTEGVAIRSFDGRLFVLTFEYTDTTAVGMGVLYQMTGSAVTQLKRWGNSTRSTRAGNLIVHNRRLWYGASNLLGFGNRAGFGIACYDPVEDAHSIPISNSDTSTHSPGSAPYGAHIVDDQIAFGGYMFAFVRGAGAFKTPMMYKDISSSNISRRYDITSAGGSVAALNGGWMTTSTYDAGTPGVKKLWRKVTVDSTIKTDTSIFVEYSLNNGDSWVTVGSITTVAGRKETEFYLQNIIGTSFKLRFTLRSTTGTNSPIFYGFNVSYIPVPEPNWMWSFTIILADKLVLLDGTEETVNAETEISFLSELWRTKQLVHFTDAEGGSWANSTNPGVLIYDITVALRDLNQPLEGEVTITLLEAVETY